MRLAEITDPDALERAYDDVLVPSFPPSELMPRAWLLDGSAARGVAVVGAYDDGDALVAAAVTEVLCPGAALLTYLAALPASRGSGVGSQLVTRIRDDAIGRGVRLLLAEVERPDRHEGSPEHGDPSARLRFYERQHAVVLDLPYVQPPISAGETPVRGMLLLALYIAPDALSAPHAVDGSLVAAAVAAMLGEEQGDDVDLAALRVASRRDTVRIRPIADWHSVPVSS